MKLSPPLPLPRPLVRYIDDLGDSNGEIDLPEFYKTAGQLTKLLAALKKGQKGPPLAPEAVEASHEQLMTSLGYKVEGVPEVTFSPTFLGDTAKNVPFKNRNG